MDDDGVLHQEEPPGGTGPGGHQHHGDHRDVLHRDQLDFTPLPRSVQLARRRAARLVAEWGLPERAGDAGVLVSELATNAVLHGCVRGRLFRVRLDLTEKRLRIAVSDPRGEAVPAPREAGPQEQFGRGLLIVASLADRWGIAPRSVGKTVRCELDRSG